MVNKVIRLLSAVRDTESATSPLASIEKTLEELPPGRAGYNHYTHEKYRLDLEYQTDDKSNERQEQYLSHYTRYDRFRPGAESLEIIEIYRQSQFKHQQGEYGQYNPNSIHDMNQKVCKYTDIIQITGGLLSASAIPHYVPYVNFRFCLRRKPYLPCFPRRPQRCFSYKEYRLSDKFFDIQAGEYDSTTVSLHRKIVL